jgi:signal transduction histidine kinase/CheY-like chemotaxis protein
VSERKLAEQALQRSEQRYRRLFQSMDEGFALCELIEDEAGRPSDFRYLEVNPAFSRQTGLPVERLVGRTAKETIPLLEDYWIETFGRVARTGVPERIENRVEALGKQFEIHAWRADGNRFALASSDVTLLRKTEERLRVAQRMESVGRLAGGIAHDFNNLLAIIINCADLAMEDVNEPSALPSSLAEIRKAGDRAAALTKQLLAFSRKQLLQPQVLDLNEIIRGMECMLRRLLGEDISLAVELAEDLGKVLADPGQVEQVLMNLAVNARDAMPDGGKLTIATANLACGDPCAALQLETDPGPWVKMSVTDTGCGMDDHTLARLFDPFFTTKELGKGTGLGLATTHGIVQQSGGTIQVHSELGKGTTFTVLFPRESASVETVTSKAAGTTRPSAGKTVLVVEDEEALRSMVERVLGRAGYTVLTAANGDEALRIFAQQQAAVHLVLTDVVMPGMNGKELADRLLQFRPEVRILYMTGYTDHAILRRGVLDPGTHLIRKPFDGAQLTQMVGVVLEGEKSSG